MKNDLHQRGHRAAQSWPYREPISGLVMTFRTAGRRTAGNTIRNFGGGSDLGRRTGM